MRLVAAYAHAASSGSVAELRREFVPGSTPHLATCSAPGPKRKNLRVRNPEKYQWKPAELLKQLARVYLNLSRADRAGDFVAAIAADERSYHEGIFVEAAEVREGGVLAVVCVQRGTSAVRWTRCP